MIAEAKRSRSNSVFHRLWLTLQSLLMFGCMYLFFGGWSGVGHLLFRFSDVLLLVGGICFHVLCWCKFSAAPILRFFVCCRFSAVSILIFFSPPIVGCILFRFFVFCRFVAVSVFAFCFSCRFRLCRFFVFLFLPIIGCTLFLFFCSADLRLYFFLRFWFLPIFGCITFRLLGGSCGAAPLEGGVFCDSPICHGTGARDADASLIWHVIGWRYFFDLWAGPRLSHSSNMHNHCFLIGWILFSKILWNRPLPGPRSL